MKRPPRQVRLEEETEAEIRKIAEITGLPQIEIIRQAVRAGVRAIRENNNELPLPLRFAVVAPTKNSSNSIYPLHRAQVALAEDRDRPAKKKSAT